MADILNTGIVPMEKDTLMRNILKIGVAALVVAGMVSPAFAHGGGGYWRCEPQNVKAAAAAKRKLNITAREYWLLSAEYLKAKFRPAGHKA